MSPQEPPQADDRESAEDRVMTGDGAEPRDGPRPTMTGDGAIIEEDGPEDRVMTGDGAEPRDGPRPEMTADGVKGESDKAEPDD
jgi:hypothetical protein